MVKHDIIQRLESQPRKVWTAVDFLDFGSRDAVDKALQRLVAEGVVRRIERGLYDLPAPNQLTGKHSPPQTSAVIDAVARRDQARLLVDGMTAANDLGLTTAVPAQIVVLTDARLKTIRLGAQEICFKQASPSRLYWAGRPGMRVVQALHWLHDTLETDRDRVVQVLRNLIARDESGNLAADLKSGLHAMPTWMQSFVRELLS